MAKIYTNYGTLKKELDDNILYRITDDYMDEQSSFLEDVKREETYKRIVIPPEVIKRELIKSLSSDEEFAYYLYRPLFRGVAITVSIISLFLFGALLTISLFIALPMIVVTLFGIYSFYYLKKD